MSLPSERYAHPLAAETRPTIGWPSDWQSRTYRCLHCRLPLVAPEPPGPACPTVELSCWGCGRWLATLVWDGYRPPSPETWRALPNDRKPRSGGPKPRGEGEPAPLCCDCSSRPATRRWRLCAPCMEARQRAATLQRQQAYRARVATREADARLAAHIERIRTTADAWAASRHPACLGCGLTDSMPRARGRCNRCEQRRKKSEAVT